MAAEVSGMLDRARESMDRALRSLDLAQGKLVSHLEEAEVYDDKLVSHLAWVTAKVAEITSALRQLEKHDRVMAKSPEQRFRLVCAYLRNEASPEQRMEVQGLLAELADARVVA